MNIGLNISSLGFLAKGDIINLACLFVTFVCFSTATQLNAMQIDSKLIAYPGLDLLSLRNGTTSNLLRSFSGGLFKGVSASLKPGPTAKMAGTDLDC